MGCCGTKSIKTNGDTDGQDGEFDALLWAGGKKNRNLDKGWDLENLVFQGEADNNNPNNKHNSDQKTKPLTEDEKKREEYMKLHYDELDDNYIKQKSRGIDVDINGIVARQREKEENDRWWKIQIEIEKEKWNRVREEEKRKELIRKEKKGGLKTKPNIIRLLFLGFKNSGKSSIITRFCYNKFSFDYHTTTEVMVIRPVNQIYDDIIYHIDMVDTPPWEMFCKDWEDELCQANIVWFVYDVTKKQELQRIKDFIWNIDFYAGQQWGIMANKIDLAPEYIKYREFEWINFSRSLNITYLIWSAWDSDRGIVKYIQSLFSTEFTGLSPDQKEGEEDNNKNNNIDDYCENEEDDNSENDKDDDF